MDACPSTFTLDDREIHGAPPDDAIGAHLASCPRCAARLATRAADAGRFQSAFSEPLWRRIDAAPRRHRRWWLGLLVPALAAAALVVVARPAVTPSARPDDSAYRAAKGALGVELRGRRAGQLFPLDPGTEARPGDEVELTVRAARPEHAYVIIGSVDGTGAFSPFYPATRDGLSVPLPPPGQPMEPPIVLDAAPGPERIVVVLSARPLPVRAIAARAEAAVARLERFTVPEAVELGADVRWVVLPKTGGAPAPVEP